MSYVSAVGFANEAKTLIIISASVVVSVLSIVLELWNLVSNSILSD